jgi:chemotaxis protein methyltransferase CheR
MARLSKFVRSGGHSSFDQYFKFVQADVTGDKLTELVDAMTTNHTSFLREPEHFRFLTTTVLEEYRRRPVIKIWSAACSTGEEPWSILFSLEEACPRPAWPDVRIMATDISGRVLRTSQEGVYTAERLAGVPPSWLTKYFVARDRTKSAWQVRPEYRSRCDFRKVNLIQPFSTFSTFQVIFCRNVMIYFNKQTQSDLVNRLATALEPGGYLMVGHSESLTGLDHSLEYVKPAIYRRVR